MIDSDSIIIPLMIAKNRASSFTVSLRVPVEQGFPQGYTGIVGIDQTDLEECTWDKFTNNKSLLEFGILVLNPAFPVSKLIKNCKVISLRK